MLVRTCCANAHCGVTSAPEGPLPSAGCRRGRHDDQDGHVSRPRQGPAPYRRRSVGLPSRVPNHPTWQGLQTSLPTWDGPNQVRQKESPGTALLQARPVRRPQPERGSSSSPPSGMQLDYRVRPTLRYNCRAVERENTRPPRPNHHRKRPSHTCPNAPTNLKPAERG